MKTKSHPDAAQTNPLIGTKVRRNITVEFKGFDDNERTLTAIASDPSTDRHGERINQAGWDLTNYKKNPVGLLFHNQWDFPVFQTLEIDVVGTALVFKAKFATKEEYDRAEVAWKLYRGGYMRTFSVGFIPKRMEGDEFLEQELLEISCVTVPSNPNAVVLAYKEDVITEAEKDILVKAFREEAERLEEATKPVTRAEIKDLQSTLTKLVATTKALTDAAEAANNKSEDTDVKTKQNTENKAGAAISGANKGKIQSVIDALDSAAQTLEGLIGSDDGDETTGKDATDTGKENKDVSNAGTKKDDDTDTDTGKEDAGKDDDTTDTDDADKGGDTDNDPDEDKDKGADKGAGDTKDKPSDDDPDGGADVDLEAEADPENLDEDQAKAVQRAIEDAEAKAAGKVD
jgi:hypothetical protein